MSDLINQSQERHFDEMTALLLLEQQLGDEREKEVAEHAKNCAQCRQLVRVLRNEDVWLRQALTEEEEPLPAWLTRRPGFEMAPWGWAAAFAFAAAGIYTLWSGFVEPWIDQASQAGFTQGNLMTMLFFSGAFWNGWSNVLAGIELLAGTTMAALGIWLLRRWVRRPARIGIAVVMGALVYALLLPSGAAAADVEHGTRNYTLPAGQEVKSDLIVWADHTQIDGTVDGDLIVGSHEVEVNGHVKGDILGFAADLRVNGAVDGNVRVFSQDASLSAPIGKNLMAFAARLDQSEKATVGGSTIVFSQDAELKGPIAGDLLAFASSLAIDGRVGGNVHVRGRDLSVGSTAEIAGKTQYEGPTQPEVAPGAKLASPIEVTIRATHRPSSAGRFVWARTLRWAAAFVLGMVLLLIAPVYFSDVVDTTKKVGLSMGVGLVCLIVTPIAAVIACLTIVGLGVGISTLLTYIVAVYTAQVFVGEWVGQRILGVETGQGPALLRLAVGLVILHGIGMIPFVGRIAMLIVVVWGLGASVLTVHRRVRQQTIAA